MSVKRLLSFAALIASLVVGHSASATTCRPIPDPLNALLSPGRILLFGEIHGTLEMPRRFYDVLCTALNNGHTVTVGLEMPYAFNEQLRDRERFDWTKTSFFTQQYQDGRASIDMHSLITAIERLQFTGSALELFLFDHRGKERDRKMADTIAEFADEEAVTLILTGNLHSRTRHGAPWDEGRGNMGAYLSEQRPQTRSILFTYEDGKAWLCNPDCGIKDVGGNAQSSDEFTVTNEPSHHHFQWFIGVPTESIPYRLYEGEGP